MGMDFPVWGLVRTWVGNIPRNLKWPMAKYTIEKNNAIPDVYKRWPNQYHIGHNWIAMGP